MSGPWEKYQPQSEDAASDGPWTKYATAEAAPQASAPQPKADFSQFHNARGPVTLSNIQIGTAPDVTPEKQADLLRGVLEGGAASVPGIPGNIEQAGRGVLSLVAPVSTETFLPTSSDVANTVFGQPNSPEQAGGRDIGDLIGPGAIAKSLKGIASITSRSSAISGAIPNGAAQAAHEAGYVLPPAMATKSPGAVSKMLGAVSGKIKLQQAASAKNQEVTNRLAAESLGLGSDVPLNDDALSAVRKDAGKDYEAVAASVPEIKPDPEFQGVVNSLGKRTTEAAKAFPGLIKNDDIEALTEALKEAKSFSPRAGLELVRHLRADASANLKAFSEPSRQALGLAQRQGADAVDDLMERNLTASGKPDLVFAYRDARQQLARTYDIEAATNSATGDVNARILGALAKKGRPLSGQLKAIADAARAFPKAMQSPASFGEKEDIGILDLGMAGMTHGATAPVSFARPGVRHLILSPRYQNALMGSGGAPGGNALSQVPAINPFAIPNVLQENALGNRPKQAE